MIYEVLPTGADNGLTGDELMTLFGIDDRRLLRKQIRQERMNRKPILNSGNKYFRSNDPRDYDAWLRTTFRKGIETIAVARAVLRERPSDDGQQMTIRDFMHTGDDEVMEESI